MKKFLIKLSLLFAMECDMCGKSAQRAVLAKVEGVEMNLCTGCSKHGSVIKVVKEDKIIERERETFNPRKEEKIEEVVIPNFSQILWREREKRKMEQDKFAQLIAEKLSILQKMEKGDITPSIDAAKMIGKKLNLNLVTKESNEPFEIPKSSGQGLTLGDLIKPKKEK